MDLAFVAHLITSGLITISLVGIALFLLLAFCVNGFFLLMMLVVLLCYCRSQPWWKGNLSGVLAFTIGTSWMGAFTVWAGIALYGSVLYLASRF